MKREEAEKCNAEKMEIDFIEGSIRQISKECSEKEEVNAEGIEDDIQFKNVDAYNKKITNVKDVISGKKIIAIALDDKCKSKMPPGK